MRTNDTNCTNREFVSYETIIENYPFPWERRGKAIFDGNGNRINLVDPSILEGIIDAFQTLERK